MADNFMTYNDAVDVLTPYAEKINTIKPEPITWAAYQLLTTAQKEAKRYVITDYPSPDGNVDKLSELEDVSISSQTLSDGQALIYDDTNDVWENKTIFEDSLTSTDTDKAITANMGHVLGEEIDAIVNVYGAKNLLKNDATSTTLNTVVVTVNDDKSVTLSGTASADSYVTLNTFKLVAGTYKLTGTPSGVSNEFLYAENLTNHAYYIDYGDGVEFTLSAESLINFVIKIESGHTASSTYYPMLCDARIVNQTYQPHVPTNRQLLSHYENGVLGTKNLCPPMQSGVDSGVTFTVNADKSVTVNGTPSGAYAYCGVEITQRVVAGSTYTVTGGHSNGKHLGVTASLADWTFVRDLGFDYGDGFTFTPDFNGYVHLVINILILNGHTCTNEVFYPMLCLASNSDLTYAPPAKTNNMLTDDIDSFIGLYGSKNLLPRMKGGSTSAYSVDFIFNKDGSITANGTATGGNAVCWRYFDDLPKAGITYRLSGGRGYGKGVWVDAYNNGVYVRTIAWSDYKVAIFTPDYSDYNQLMWGVYIDSGQTCTNETFYPVLCDNRIANPDFTSPAKTNLQLTQDKAERVDLASLNLQGTKNTTGVTITSGTYLYLNGQYCRVIQDVDNGADFTENTNYVVTSLGGDLQSKFVLIGAKVFMASADGVKTNQTLINDVMTQLQSWISSHPNHGYTFNFLYVGGASGLPTDCNVRTYYTDMVFNQTGVTNTQFFMRYINAKTSASESYRGVGTLTLTDESYEISQYDVHLYIHDYQIL